MAQRVFSFVVVLILFFNVEIFSQEKPGCMKLLLNYNTQANFEFRYECLPDCQLKESIAIFKNFKCDSVVITIYKPLFVMSKSILTPSFYFNNLGFFCKKELQLEKITSVPFRFRLGSLAYVNYLEQKPNAKKP